ncbi:MAG: P-loop NTPase [Gemmatimonas sp.]|nr:P-loop NTPase [Gemmatimonas sp.]
MRNFRTYGEVPATPSHPVLAQVGDQRARLGQRLAKIHHIVPVVSGKGGVGKSAVSANLAAALALRGFRVGAVDGDLNGPSLAAMLGVSPEPLQVTDDGVVPAVGAADVRLVATDLLLEAADTPLRWRGPPGDEFLWRGALEAGTLREFLSDVVWGDLDFLVVDLPPGTDRIQRFLEFVPDPAAVLLVTTPSRAAARVVARAEALLSSGTRFGTVMNMAAGSCPHCGGTLPLFDAPADPGRDPHTIDFWGEIPFDHRLAHATDAGRPIVLDPDASRAATALWALTDRVLTECEF